MKEEWVTINGFSNYEVSNYGYVRQRGTFRNLDRTPDHNGYLRVIMRSNDGDRRVVYLSQLVAAAFFSDFREGMRVINVTGDYEDCSIINLRLRRPKRMNNYDPNDPNSSWGKPVRVVETGQVYRTVRQCAKALDSGYSGIYAVLRGERQRHLGLTFEYYEG